MKRSMRDSTPQRRGTERRVKASWRKPINMRVQTHEDITLCLVDAWLTQVREQKHETTAADCHHSHLFVPCISGSKASNRRKYPWQPRASIFSSSERVTAAFIQQSVIVSRPMCCRFSWSIQRNRGCCFSRTFHSHMVTTRRALAGKRQGQSGRPAGHTQLGFSDRRAYSCTS
jgi:hypothetical protein